MAERLGSLAARLGSLGTLAVLAVLIASCGGAPAGSPAATGVSPAPPATSAPVLGEPALKLALVRTLGPLWYCDPDFYPVQRADEIVAARERWAEVTADAAVLAAILADRGLPAAGGLTDAQKLVAYRAWKMLAAIALVAGKDGFAFDYLAQPATGGTTGTHVTGTIGPDGRITTTMSEPASAPVCPICLSRGTPIETPAGPVAVERLRIGDAAWTLDAAGHRIAGVVVAVGSTAVPPDHRVVRLVLADGRTVTASPGHPLADGRRLGDLRAGDAVDGSTVASATLLPYAGGETFDIVVTGGTGVYLVDGIALGSTLVPAR